MGSSGKAYASGLQNHPCGARPGSQRVASHIEVRRADFGWPQDPIDGALVVLANVGQMRVTGEDGKAASLPDLPAKRSAPVIFRAETTVITIGQRMAARGLLTD